MQSLAIPNTLNEVVFQDPSVNAGTAREQLVAETENQMQCHQTCSSQLIHGGNDIPTDDFCDAVIPADYFLPFDLLEQI